MKPCTTHHHACDCREEAFRHLLHGIMSTHQDEDSCDYNECEIDPCDWCVKAEALVGELKEVKSK